MRSPRRRKSAFVMSAARHPPDSLLMEKVMTRINSDCRKSKRLAARRLTLLASVGALGAAMLLVGPGGQYSHPAIGVAPASAAEFGMQHPVGFADIVAKVKPAVISVRVKLS